MKGISTIAGQLRVNIQGEVLDDPYSLGMYSTDASLYQIFPLCICLPKSTQDIIEIVRIANQFQLPILPRGGATSLAGQTVAKAIVVDYSKYLNQIIEYNKEEQWIKVEPGITRDELNHFVWKDGLHFAPDPATSNRATIGGMIANNSSGTKSIFYGKTSDHVIELEVLLMNGSILHLKDYSEKEFKDICDNESPEGNIFGKFRELIFSHSDLIAARFPKIMRRVSGYALDSFIHGYPWNLSKLICGSEGTLGQILSAKIKLVPLPKKKILSVFHFSSRKEAIESVEDIVSFEPAAVEMLDYNILELSKGNPLSYKFYKHCIQGDPRAVLITEFYGENSNELEQKLHACITHLKKQDKGFAWPVFDSEQDMQMVWALRKQGLGLIMGGPGDQKPIPFVEDSSIPLEHLSEYISRVDDLCRQLDTQMVIYAHASVGVLHIRPFLNTANAEDLDKLKTISSQALQWVKEFGGSWSGEHGDGLVRSPGLREYFGEEIIACFEQIKDLFDPDRLLNPGKIVNPPPLDQNMRYGLDYKELKWESIFHFRELGSFNNVVHNCSGIGACRKPQGGTMCPSYMATKDEEHSTRGRANALRLAISGQLNGDRIPSDRLLEVLDLCLSCKACKTECPSNVDMAKLKSEVLQKKYDRRKIGLRDRLIRDSANWSRKSAGTFSGFVNTIQRSWLFRHGVQPILGLEPARVLPSYANQSLVQWFKKRPSKPTGSDKKVLLFADTYTNYHEPQIGRVAVGILESCGFEVILEDLGCCQRPRISNGFLMKAKKEGTITAHKLSKYMDEDIPIIVLEPGCASSLQSDLPDLVDDEELAMSLKEKIMLIDEFLFQQADNGNLPGEIHSKYEKLLIHGHCHQKALYGMEGMEYFSEKQEQCDVYFPDSGCCGMAGAFGYEKEHYNISNKIGELVLFPAIREHPAHVVVANGFSCRHQIRDFTGRNAIHWIESIEYVKAE